MQAPSLRLLQTLHRTTWSVHRAPSVRPVDLPRSTVQITSLVNHKVRLCRPLTTTTGLQSSTADNVPTSPDRGPPSEEDTQTDFGQMDIFASTAEPATTIDACLPTGFHLNNGMKITDGDGVILLGGQAFAWRPWLTTSLRSYAGMLNSKGGWEVSAPEAWGILEAVFPKPDLLILGLGRNVLPLGRETKGRLHKMGIRVDIQDTRNAAAEFNLLATERGVNSVAAALVPIGWNSVRG